MIKTNAMRMLDKAKIKYQTHEYENNGFVDGVTIASKMGMDENKVFKTLVTVAPSKNNYVFVIPVAKELNLKACAASVGEKSVEMIHVKDITKVTGYIRGGCSPIGMKKLVGIFDDHLLIVHNILVIVEDAEIKKFFAWSGFFFRGHTDHFTVEPEAAVSIITL